MRTQITIQTVPNGWIVREIDFMEHRAPRVLAVFNKLEDLQAALPTLLEVEQKGTEGTEGTKS
jgi:hypothetical protein